VLAGGDDLVGLRTRGTSARPFEVCNQIQSEAQARATAPRSGPYRQSQGDPRQAGKPHRKKDQSNAPPTLSAEQTKAIEEFRADMVQTRRQLRDVQAALRSDIRRLKAGLEFLDIALIRSSYGARHHPRRAALETAPPAHGESLRRSPPIADGAIRTLECRNEPDPSRRRDNRSRVCWRSSRLLRRSRVAAPRSASARSLLLPRNSAT